MLLYFGNYLTIKTGSMVIRDLRVELYESVALAIDSQEKINALHAKALELGGTDEGAPGERMPGFYAAYFRDPDGNKLAFFKMG